MSANLLRRAARTLRQRVQGLPVDWKERWEVITTDSESLSGVAPEHPGHTGDTHWPCDRCEHFETYREGLAAYVRLLDPLVADALAAWLDDAAKDAEARVVAELHVGMQPGDLVSPREELAVRLARAICRTRPEGPVSTSPETGPGGHRAPDAPPTNAGPNGCPDCPPGCVDCTYNPILRAMCRCYGSAGESTKDGSE